MICSSVRPSFSFNTNPNWQLWISLNCYHILDRRLCQFTSHRRTPKPERRGVMCEQLNNSTRAAVLKQSKLLGHEGGCCLAFSLLKVYWILKFNISPITHWRVFSLRASDVASYLLVFSTGSPPWSAFWSRVHHQYKWRFMSKCTVHVTATPTKKTHLFQCTGRGYDILRLCSLCASTYVLYLYIYMHMFFSHVSAPPTGVPCPDSEVFVVRTEPWVRPVGTSPASLLSLPRFHAHPILCTSVSPLVMGRCCVVNTTVEKLTHACVRVTEPWEKGSACVLRIYCMFECVAHAYAFVSCSVSESNNSPCFIIYCFLSLMIVIKFDLYFGLLN